MDAAPTPEILFVPVQYATLQAAVDAVSGPATIIVSPGLYNGTVTIIDKPSLVIQSAQLSRRGVTLGAADGESVLHVERSTLHLSGIEIRSNARARGVLALDATINLQECIVAGNRLAENAAERFGAGMLCRNSRVRLQKSALIGNVIDGAANAGLAGGGGLYLQNCQAEIAGCTIQANAIYGAGTARGGGVWCENSSLRMWRSRVTDNAVHAAPGEGAGMYFKAPVNTQLGGSVITGNGAPDGAGGGIFIEDNPTRVAVHRNTMVRQNHPTDIASR